MECSTATPLLVLMLMLMAATITQARLLTTQSQSSRGDTLSCVTSAVKGPSGEDLRSPVMSVLSQRRFNNVQSSVGSQGEAACLRMKVHCVDDNHKQHCTQADYASQAWKWAYALTTTNVCEYYRNVAAPSGSVSDVFCCTSNGCNGEKAMETSASAQAAATAGNAREQP